MNVQNARKPGNLGDEYTQIISEKLQKRGIRQLDSKFKPLQIHKSMTNELLVVIKSVQPQNQLFLAVIPLDQDSMASARTAMKIYQLSFEKVIHT